MRETKSILDNVPVKETESFREAFYVKSSKPIVGNCPKCGAPIYGERVLLEGDTPSVVHSCDCRSASNSLAIQTK